MIENRRMPNADRSAREGSLDHTRAYYDEFSKSYERHRRPNHADGYHALVDDLEIDLCARYGTGRDILECGCGTGLILERLAGFARRAAGRGTCAAFTSSMHRLWWR